MLLHAPCTCKYIQLALSLLVWIKNHRVGLGLHYTTLFATVFACLMQFKSLRGKGKYQFYMPSDFTLLRCIDYQKGKRFKIGVADSLWWIVTRKLEETPQSRIDKTINHKIRILSKACYLWAQSLTSWVQWLRDVPCPRVLLMISDDTGKLFSIDTNLGIVTSL